MLFPKCNSWREDTRDARMGAPSARYVVVGARTRRRLLEDAREIRDGEVSLEREEARELIVNVLRNSDIAKHPARARASLIRPAPHDATHYATPRVGYYTTVAQGLG